MSVTLLLGWLVAVAATAGPDMVLAPHPTPSVESAPVGGPAPRVSLLPPEEDRDKLPPAPAETAAPVAIAATVISVVLLVVAVLAIVAAVRWWRHRDPVTEDPVAPVGVPGTAPVVADAEAEVYRSALATGSPRNGIVACWVELEHVLARAGTAASPSDSPTEFVTRALREHAVPEDAVTELADAYREARFSRHEMDEVDRSRAARALSVVDAALRGRSV